MGPSNEDERATLYVTTIRGNDFISRDDVEKYDYVFTQRWLRTGRVVPKEPNVVYFDQQTGASWAICWSKLSFPAFLYPFPSQTKKELKI